MSRRTLMPELVHPTMRHPRTGERVRGFVLPSGRVCWPIAGGDGNDPPETPPPAPVVPDGYRSQDEVQRIAAAEKAQGERAGRRALLTELGLDENAKPEEVKARLEQAEQIRRQQETEAETKAREAAEAATAAQAREAAAAARELDARKTVALVRAGLAPKDGATAEEQAAYDATLSDALKLVDVPANADDAAIKTAVEALKTRIPALLTVAAAPAPPTPPAPIPGGRPNPPAPDDKFEAGRQRALQQAERAQPLVTASMFGN